MAAAFGVAAATWLYVATNPTIQAAYIAAAASGLASLTSVVNTLLLRRHERHVDERLDERRNVIVKGTPEDPGAVIVTGEERRDLEDRRAPVAEKRKLRERRRRKRRNGPL